MHVGYHEGPPGTLFRNTHMKQNSFTYNENLTHTQQRGSPSISWRFVPCVYTWLLWVMSLTASHGVSLSHTQTHTFSQAYISLRLSSPSASQQIPCVSWARWQISVAPRRELHGDVSASTGFRCRSLCSRAATCIWTSPVQTPPTAKRGITRETASQQMVCG